MPCGVDHAGARHDARAARGDALDQLDAVVARHALRDAATALRRRCSATPRRLRRSAVSMPTMPPPMIVTLLPARHALGRGEDVPRVRDRDRRVESRDVSNGDGRGRAPVATITKSGA